MPSDRVIRGFIVIVLVVAGGLIALSVFGGGAGGACGLSSAAVLGLEEELEHGHARNDLVVSGVATAACVEVAEKELHSQGLGE